MIANTARVGGVTMGGCGVERESLGDDGRWCPEDEQPPVIGCSRWGDRPDDAPVQ